jgi:hypothetical protein
LDWGRRKGRCPCWIGAEERLREEKARAAEQLREEGSREERGDRARQGTRGKRISPILWGRFRIAVDR